MTDSLLVSKAKTGDSSAWADLIKKYSAFVEAKSKNYSTNNNIDEKDLYQEGMIGLISAVHSFDENRKTEFKTYAETVICNQMLSALRNANSKKNLPLSTYVSIEEDDEFVSPTPSPEEAFLLNEELELVNGFIENNLSKTEAKVFKLHSAGFSYGEIAEILDCSEKSVDNAIQRIRKKIKNYKPF